MFEDWGTRSDCSVFLAWAIIAQLGCDCTNSVPPRYDQDRNLYSGTVDLDETCIGGEKPEKHGREAAGKVLVVVMVEVTEGKIGRIPLRRVPDASGPSLEAGRLWWHGRLPSGLLEIRR